MSLEKDITGVKHIFEDDFKGADDKEIADRRKHYDANQRKEMFKNAEEVLPGSIAKLKEHFKDDVLVETAVAYADTDVVADLLYCEHLTGQIRDANAKNMAFHMRALGWVGVWTDAATFVKQAEIIQDYNYFDVDVAKQLAKDFSSKQFRLCRESSPGLYIRPVVITMDEVDFLEKYDAKQDEINMIGNELYFWWD